MFKIESSNALIAKIETTLGYLPDSNSWRGLFAFN